MRKSDNRRHILALSGGKDSAALAVYLKDKPGLEYVFLDTGHELPETYEYLNRMRAILGIEIRELKPKRDFDFWLKIFKGCLPSVKNRWCTRELKIIPYEQYIGNNQVVSYIGLRADEDRMGYISSKVNIVPMYPFIEDNFCKEDIIQILEDSGLGLPAYYKWRSRSGCYFCFFQRKVEWIGLHDNHPDLFKKAWEYESNHSDGRTYTWIQGTSLKVLLLGRDKINANKPQKKSFQSKKLCNILKAEHFDFGSKSILRDSHMDVSRSPQNKEEEEACLFCTL